MADDKIVEIEDFAKLPEDQKIITIYAMAYRCHQTVQSLPCMNGGCPQRSKFNKVERSGIWAGLGTAFAAFIITVYNLLTKHTGN